MGLGDFVTGILGSKNEGHTDPYATDPNAFQYGGQPGGAASREASLSGLGAQAGAAGVTGLNYGNTMQYQLSQNDALGMMKQQAMGNDGGVAENQLKQGAANAAQEQFSGAASTRGGGGNIAAAQMNAANNAAAGAAGANFQAGQIRAQNQQAGIQNYGNFAQSALGQQAQMAQAQGQYQLGQEGIQQGYEGMNNQIGMAQLGAQENQQQLNSSNYNSAAGINAGVNSQNADQNKENGGVLLGLGAQAASSAMSSSDENMKMDVQPQYGATMKPGGGDMFDARTYTQSGGNAQGEAALAARDAHTANFKQMGTGMGDWFNASNAQPWTKEASAAGSNLSHFFGSDRSGNAGMMKGYGGELSDEKAKKHAVRQDSLAEDAKAAAKMRNDMDNATGDFSWMRQDPNNGTIPAHAAPVRGDGMPRPGQPTDNAADQFLYSGRGSTYKYKDPRENEGELSLGPMAQKLRAGPTGEDLVDDTPRGQMVDTKRLSLANTAGAARLHERDMDNRQRLDEHDAKIDALASQLGGGGEESMPAGKPNLSPRLAPEEHGLYSVLGDQKIGAPIDDSHQVLSDERAKKEVRAQGRVEGFEQGLKAAGADPRFQDDPKYMKRGLKILRQQHSSGVDMTASDPMYNPRPHNDLGTPDLSHSTVDDADSGNIPGFKESHPKIDPAVLQRTLAGASRPERTALSPSDEKAFQHWAATHKIHDLDNPDSHYDYRGAFKAGASPVGGHWPDTFKQHGHPTFSVESQYSRGPNDGGSWSGDTFLPQARR